MSSICLLCFFRIKSKSFFLTTLKPFLLFFIFLTKGLSLVENSWHIPPCINMHCIKTLYITTKGNTNEYTE